MSEKENEKKVELYKKHRPQKFSDLWGQSDAVRALTEMGKKNAIPHCTVLSGPSGCGKTTICRILQQKMQCSEWDFEELNCAGEARGIDTIRDIGDRMGMSPMAGPVRVWLLDEAHKLTQDAQTALLKILEDTPDHVYFFLATTEPHKLITTIRTRATEIKVKLVNDKDMKGLLAQVATKESFDLKDEVLEEIVNRAEGSPRKALVLMNQILNITGESNQINAVMTGTSGAQAIDLARLFFRKSVSWSEIAKVLKSMEDEPEGVRRVILGYAQALLLSNKDPEWAFTVIDIFRKSLMYEGKPGLCAMCYECWKESNG